jgi:hypothetical protein
MRTPFNRDRFIPLDFHGQHQQVNVTDVQPLARALAEKLVQPGTPVLYTQRGDTVYVFQTRHFSMYNVMQNRKDTPPWMATFCAVCNAGMSFSPVLDGRTYDFYGAGFYDAMTLLADVQTGSFWDHITGECIEGTLKGRRLERLANMTHATASMVSAQHPDAQLVLTQLDPGRAALDDLAESIRTQPDAPWLPALLDTLDETQEDTRLPRLEMGLGVWVGREARFYPFRTIHGSDNIIFDEIAGQRLLVYGDPETATPAAMYTDAVSAAWVGDRLVLDNGQTLEAGTLRSGSETVSSKRPLQLFQRWYGFAITFPGCDIYRAAEAVPRLSGAAR